MLVVAVAFLAVTLLDHSLRGIGPPHGSPAG